MFFFSCFRGKDYLLNIKICIDIDIALFEYLFHKASQLCEKSIKPVG